MDIKRQNQALQDLRSQYRDLLDATLARDTDGTQSDETAVDTDIPTDNADAATVEFERERDEAFVSQYESLLAQIDRALEKIEAGTYGVCEVCGRTISNERLVALPMALLCIDDQEVLENAP
jgi:RNA polymerase-binding protein DksA